MLFYSVTDHIHNSGPIDYTASWSLSQLSIWYLHNKITWWYHSRVDPYPQMAHNSLQMPCIPSSFYSASTRSVPIMLATTKTETNLHRTWVHLLSLWSAVKAQVPKFKDESLNVLFMELFRDGPSGGNSLGPAAALCVLCTKTLCQFSRLWHH